MIIRALLTSGAIPQELVGVTMDSNDKSDRHSINFVRYIV